MENQQAAIDLLVVEKTALDQSWANEIRVSYELRKQHLMKDKYIEDLGKQIQGLLKDKNDLTAERDILKNNMTHLASEAQAIEG